MVKLTDAVRWFIHGLVTFSCLHKKITKISAQAASTFIANIKHKAKCTIMQKLSVHELVIGLNVQRNGQMKLTASTRKRSLEVNGFLLQYFIWALSINGTLNVRGKKTVRFNKRILLQANSASRFIRGVTIQLYIFCPKAIMQMVSVEWIRMVAQFFFSARFCQSRCNCCCCILMMKLIDCRWENINRLIAKNWMQSLCLKNSSWTE